MGIKKLSEGRYRLEWYPFGRKKDPKTGKPCTIRDYLEVFGTEADAQLQYAEILRSLGKVRSIAPKINEILPEFIIYYKNKNKDGTMIDWNYAWKHLTPVFGDLRPAAITPSMIESYKASRKAKPVTISKELIYLSGVIRWMVESNYADPLRFKIRGFPRNKTAPPPVYRPSPTAIHSILGELIEPQRSIFTVIYLCGLRRSEALKLTIEQVNFEVGYLHLFGKGNKERFVPLNDQAKEILKKSIGDRKSGYVWINPWTEKPYREISFALKKAAKRAGVELNVYPHLLRHASLTNIAAAGANAFQIAALAGHSDISTSQKYVEAAMQDLGGLVQSLSFTERKKNSDSAINSTPSQSSM